MTQPQEFAQKFGNVHRQNYLAHTIRELEIHIIREHGKDYHIATIPSPRLGDDARVHFSARGCQIVFPYGESYDDKHSRAILAHELGHIVYNISKLFSLTELNKKQRRASPEEEIFSWEFAFHLLKIKSNYYSSCHNAQSFIYTDTNLSAIIIGLVDKHAPHVKDSLETKLPGV